MAGYYYFDDLQIGTIKETSAITITEADIIAFATQFDPQPMHTDPEAAKAITGGLIASGWHTASLTMRLLITEGGYNWAPGALGLGFESLKWHQPVRPGDQLRLRAEVIHLRPSNSRPDRGILTSKLTTLNQKNEIVQSMITNVIIPRRPM